jgi:hypothetical protein
VPDSTPTAAAVAAASATGKSRHEPIPVPDSVPKMTAAAPATAAPAAKGSGNRTGRWGKTAPGSAALASAVLADAAPAVAVPASAPLLPTADSGPARALSHHLHYAVSELQRQQDSHVGTDSCHRPIAVSMS